MAKRQFNSRGRFTPKNKPGKYNAIDVSSPQLAQFLAELEAGSSVLAEDLTATESVGGVVANETVFTAGTPLEDIIRLMLEGIPTAGLSGFQLLDENLSLLADTVKIAGDEYTIGGIRFIYNDPAGLVDSIQYTPGNEAAEIFAPPATQGQTNNIDVTVDYTAGGTSSDFPYIFAQTGVGSNNAKLTPGFSLKMIDAESNQVGNTVNTSLTWTPPAFMLNIPQTTGQLSDWDSLSGIINSGTYDALSGLLTPGLALLFNSIYYPIIRHTKSGSYSSSDIDVNGDPVAWYQPTTITANEQVGSGDQGVPQDFYPEAEYRQVWFIPAGGQVTPSGAEYSNITVGGGTYSPTMMVNTVDIDISQLGLGLSNSATECKITYRVFASPQTNSIFPGSTPNILFNS